MIDKLLGEIEELIETDYFEYDAEEKFEQLEQAGAGIEILPQLFQIMERHPVQYIGMPGPLVDYIENFSPAHEEYLVESVKRRPTIHTVLMMNRCINGNSDRKEYISLLKAVSENSEIEQEIRDDAQGYVEFQEKRSESTKAETRSEQGIFADVSEESRNNIAELLKNAMSNPNNLKNPTDSEGNAAFLTQFMGLFGGNKSE